jgi:hypothetical protein
LILISPIDPSVRWRFRVSNQSSEFTGSPEHPDQIDRAGPVLTVEHCAQQPRASTGICEAQRIDFEAACENKISRGQYFAKWGIVAPARYRLDIKAKPLIIIGCELLKN